ncbi:hypothetical protein CEE37_02835 [candidate division LCP-89 bacterium B3_LCP]|uniref:Glycosyltransferase RgtA/B/C/D-like domain-containing protein n=1 Tax=candidate division LCP-89 bacterium B3_LCP TaxID=2012998 RepID=A0A532V2R6_UNCL8|nr:MAG: hypothetical protein CEE37_02835 [candidate division LCP-89 bacterium B3_LCP]
MSGFLKEPEFASQRNLKRLILIIALIAVVLRLLAIWIRSADIEQNAFEFGRIAENIIAGNGFSYDFWGRYPLALTSWMAPLYPYILAGYYTLFGHNLLGMAVIQAILGGVVCWVLGLIGVRISSGFVGVTAAAICAIYPESIFHPQKFVSEPWLLVFEVLFVLCGANYIWSGKSKYLILAGILSGLAVLCKESALLLPIALIVWVGLKKGLKGKTMLKALIPLALTVVIIAPWTVRNYIVFDKFIPVRTNFWFNVWRGVNPHATGTPRGFDKLVIEKSMASEYLSSVDSRLHNNEIQREGVYREFALRHIKDDPLRYLGLSLRRLVYFWSVDPTHPLTGHPLYWLPWLGLLILAGLGVFAMRVSWQDYSLWYLLFFVTTVVFSLTLVLPRYRIPLQPGLMLLAAEGIRWITRRWFTSDHYIRK